MVSLNSEPMDVANVSFFAPLTGGNAREPDANEPSPVSVVSQTPRRQPVQGVTRGLALCQAQSPRNILTALMNSSGRSRWGRWPESNWTSWQLGIASLVLAAISGPIRSLSKQ